MCIGRRTPMKSNCIFSFSSHYFSCHFYGLNCVFVLSLEWNLAVCSCTLQFLNTCPFEPVVCFLKVVSILGICALSLGRTVTSGLVTDSCLDNIFNTRKKPPDFKISIFMSLYHTWGVTIIRMNMTGLAFCAWSHGLLWHVLSFPADSPQETLWI